MLKQVLAIMFMAGCLSAAEITIQVKNDAGSVVSTVSIQTTNTILAELNNVRKDETMHLVCRAQLPARGQSYPGMFGCITGDAVLYQWDGAAWQDSGQTVEPSVPQSVKRYPTSAGYLYWVVRQALRKEIRAGRRAAAVDAVEQAAETDIQ